MDRFLARRLFFVGDRYTVADIALYGYSHTAPEAGLDLTSYGAVSDWMERVRAQPKHVSLEAS
jgi:glutathione S-transferase